MHVPHARDVAKAPSAAEETKDMEKNNNRNINNNNKRRKKKKKDQQEAPLSLDDVEELSRRREQLQSDLETSLARIAEIQAWIRQKNDEIHDQNADAKDAHRQQELEYALQELTAARAAVWAVPVGLWKDLYSLRHPPPAVAAIVKTAVCLLGERLYMSWERCCGIRDLRRRIVKREPSAVTAAELATVQRCDLNLKWSFDRVVRVHPTLGPLHRWIAAMLRASKAAAKAGNVKKEVGEDGERKSAAAAAKTAALMREMEEHAEYVQLAREELAAIDALLRDATHEVDVHDASVETPCSSPKTRSNMTLSLTDASTRPQTESLASGRSSTLSATEKGSVRQQPLRQQEPRNADVADAVRSSTFSFSFSFSAAAAASTSTTAADVPSIVPRLRLESCGVGNVESNTGMAGSVVRSDVPRVIRARFEELRASPRIRSPRLGRPVTVHSARLVEGSTCNNSKTFLNSVSPCGSAALLQERADLLQRVHDLEDGLKEAYHRNPSMAEFQLMRDEMTAAKQELLALRVEHSQLLGQTKRCSLYRLRVSRENGAQDESCDGDGGAAATTIRELEEQLRAAHEKIQQLEAQAALNTLRGMNASVSSEHSDRLTQTGGDNPFNAHATLPTGGGEDNAVSCAPTPRQKQQQQMQQQKRLDDALQQLEAQRDALAVSEERLNQEMHAHHARQQQVRQLQEELTTVWKRLESAEHQLRLTLEERDDHMEGRGGVATRRSMPGESRDVAASLHYELKQLHQRDVANQQTIERLRVELATLKRRRAEERQRQKDLRAARAAMLERLEKTFAEALRRQDCSMRAIPQALARARNELGQLNMQRS
ncbi:hypothetical protein TcG_01448 [Trypanosoma cruzi]|nr:hypothetical protein TcG_01448 [Trypanosoma cruzi]